jgi:hypothetical protein
MAPTSPDLTDCYRLQNEFLQGHDVYPKTLVSAHHLLTYWKQESFNSDNVATYKGLAFIMFTMQTLVLKRVQEMMQPRLLPQPAC